MSAEQVPSTGEFRPYAHFFFEMVDGSYIAFFDLGRNEMPQPSPNTPDWVMHFAMEVDTVEDVLRFRKRLNDAGVKTTDIIDHDFINSIYFFDPNGLRLEVTARVEKPGQLDQMRRDAHGELDKWLARKAELNATA
jgi:catechol 2,3-dioxygenase-like lactoylglutathione lyase family enzyme